MKPWLKVLSYIKNRTNYTHVGIAKCYIGIKCLITADEIRRLWIRDKASKMERPTIDRINPKGHYKFSNCRFIENRLNCSLATKNKSSKYIGIFVDKSCPYKKWRGERVVNGKAIRTPRFHTEREAFKEYKRVFGLVPSLRIDS